MRLRLSRSATTGYVTAVASTLAATVLTWWLTPERVGLGSLFFAAVMLSAWHGGLAAGLVATALSSFSTAYIFFHPPGSLVVDVDDLIRLGVFVAVAVLISSLHTRTRESEQAALRAREEAERANQAKDRFLAVVSHELRNPLNPVLTIASLWERDPTLPPEARSDMAVVRRNIELESRLIEDLLDLSRITAGKLTLRRQVVDMAHVLRDAVAVCQQQAREKQLKLEVNTAGEGIQVEGDPARLRQVVWNLLSNAVKFTPNDGRIDVSLSTSDTTAASAAKDTVSAPAVHLTVRDSGVGMDAATLGKVFDAFEQGGRDVTTRFGGLGLGLAIAKALAEAHGGVLTAQSDGPGRGSTFALRLPLAPPPPRPPQQAPAFAPPSPSATVLNS